MNKRGNLLGWEQKQRNRRGVKKLSLSLQKILKMTIED